mgnify:CR=1 FL=1
MIDWDSIDTVLLDMDGTLLDLHYDNHFWLEYLPQRYADLKGISPEDKKTAIDVAIKKVKSELMAAVDRDLARATTLSAMPRGTTGKSGVDYIDVIAEIFAPLSRKTAKENNTKALTSSGLI